MVNPLYVETGLNTKAPTRVKYTACQKGGLDSLSETFAELGAACQMFLLFVLLHLYSTLQCSLSNLSTRVSVTLSGIPGQVGLRL